MDTQAFFHHYQQAFCAAEIGQLLSCCSLPLVHFDELGNQQLFNDIAPLVAWVRQHVERYQTLGVERFALNIEQAESLNAATMLCRVSWQLQAKNDQRLAFTSSYVLQKQAGQWLITAILSHDENNQINALVQS